MDLTDHLTILRKPVTLILTWLGDQTMKSTNCPPGVELLTLGSAILSFYANDSWPGHWPEKNHIKLERDKGEGVGRERERRGGEKRDFTQRK